MTRWSRVMQEVSKNRNGWCYVCLHYNLLFAELSRCRYLDFTFRFKQPSYLRTLQQFQMLLSTVHRLGLKYIQTDVRIQIRSSLKCCIGRPATREGNRTIASRNFQNHIWLSVTATSCIILPHLRSYQLVAALAVVPKLHTSSENAGFNFTVIAITFRVFRDELKN